MHFNLKYYLNLPDLRELASAGGLEHGVKQGLRRHCSNRPRHCSNQPRTQPAI